METDTTIDDNPTGFRKLIGLKIRELGDGYAIMELRLSKKHLNSQGSIHGGIIATMIDHAGGTAGCHSRSGSRRKAVTLSLTTSFLAPAFSGKVIATSRKRPGGKRIFVCTTEISDESGKLLAVGEATYRYVDH